MRVEKILTISKSLSRLRNLNFVSTPLPSTKSLDQDICQDLKFLANLDSLSWSQSSVTQFYHISWLRFLNLLRFLSLKSLKKSWKCWDISSLDKFRQSWFISTVSMKILTQLNLNWKVSILKILTKKKNNLVLTVRITSTSFKSWSRQIEKSQSQYVLMSLRSRPPGLYFLQSDRQIDFQSSFGFWQSDL